MTISSKYPSIKPSLLLDFANTKSIDPRIIFSRASTATYFDNTGLMKTAAANVGRINHDPVTGACKGFLIEEQRTNLLTYSEKFDNAAWAKARSTITANAATAPDGSTAADMMTTDATGSGSGYMYQGFSFTSGQAYSVSVYAKAGSENVIYIQSFTQSGLCEFTLSGAGSVGTPSGIASNPQIQHVGNGWYRCSVVFTASATATNNVSPCAVVPANSTVYIWGAQLEAGAFPTSYIPTTSAQVTRAADSASMTGANFTSWYNPSEGTFVTTADSLFSSSSFPTACVAHDGTSNNVIYLSIRGSSSSGRQEITTGGVSQVASNSGAISSGSSFSESASYKLNDCALSVNGLSAVTDTSATIPAVTTLSIGSERSVTGYLNGHIKRLAYYPKRLANTELQAITS